MSALQERQNYLQNSFIVSALSGSIAGVGQVFSGQPLDIIKVRLQNQSAASAQSASAVGCAKSIFAEEGPLAVSTLLHVTNRFSFTKEHSPRSVELCFVYLCSLESTNR